ncbi:hypothetical protein [Alkalihalobacillus pseudalcaliphilus]|nr:hypothetical protein [Alkalihalobacillus pseudalcaliphilus]
MGVLKTLVDVVQETIEISKAFNQGKGTKRVSSGFVKRKTIKRVKKLF